MKIVVVTPAPAGSSLGNRVSSVRYARILRKLGARVTVVTEYADQPADLLVALHARRSAASVRRFHQLHPTTPIIVVMTGTDLYRDLPKSKAALHSMELATRLVVLQPMGVRAIPARLRHKVHSIVQSAEPLRRRSNKSKRYKAATRRKKFRVLQLAHLRPVKNPWLVARAARLLPENSTIEVVHAGAPLQAGSAKQALRNAELSPRYRWIGGVPRSRARQLLAGSQLLVLSSKLEGGANVICEALAMDVPVVCSRIPGSIGLLGADYPGFFPPGNAAALAKLLHRAASDNAFYQKLRSACRQRKPLVAPARELQGWRELLRSIR